MISIRPIPIPVFENSEKRISDAWVVDEVAAVYLEYGKRLLSSLVKHRFSWVPMETGIGGRLIEPVFKDDDNYIMRSYLLCYNDGNNPDMTNQIKEAWYQKRMRDHHGPGLADRK